MRRETLVMLGLAALAAVLAVAGLMVVGGPESARSEQRDQQRLRNIRDMAECLRGKPADMAGPSTCDLNDPATQAPYAWSRPTPEEIKVCASFELPDLLPTESYRGSLDPATGCLTVSLENGG